MQSTKTYFFDPKSKKISYEITENNQARGGNVRDDSEVLQLSNQKITFKGNSPGGIFNEAEENGQNMQKIQNEDLDVTNGEITWEALIAAVKAGFLDEVQAVQNLDGTYRFYYLCINNKNDEEKSKNNIIDFLKRHIDIANKKSSLLSPNNNVSNANNVLYDEVIQLNFNNPFVNQNDNKIESGLNPISQTLNNKQLNANSNNNSPASRLEESDRNMVETIFNIYKLIKNNQFTKRDKKSSTYTLSANKIFKKVEKFLKNNIMLFAQNQDKKFEDLMLLNANVFDDYNLLAKKIRNELNDKVKPTNGGF